MQLIRTIEIYGHTVEIYDMEYTTTKGARYVAKVDGEWDWTERRSSQAVQRAIEAQLAPEPAPALGNVTSRTGWSKYSRSRDQAGGYIADSFGLTSPATARGECHYCGQALNRYGECEECV